MGLTLGLSPKSPVDVLTPWEHPSLPQPPAPGPQRPAGSSPPRQHLGDLGPAVAEHLVGLTDDAVLLLRPAGLLYLGVEVVMPALTALLPQPALQVLGDQRPLLRAVLLDQLDDLGKGLCEAKGTRPPSPPNRTVQFLPHKPHLTVAWRGPAGHPCPPPGQPHHPWICWGAGRPTVRKALSQQIPFDPPLWSMAP